MIEIASYDVWERVHELSKDIPLLEANTLPFHLLKQYWGSKINQQSVYLNDIGEYARHMYRTFQLYLQLSYPEMDQKSDEYIDLHDRMVAEIKFWDLRVCSEQFLDTCEALLESGKYENYDILRKQILENKRFMILDENKRKSISNILGALEAKPQEILNNLLLTS